MVIELDGEVHPIEIKKSTNTGTEILSTFRMCWIEGVCREEQERYCVYERHYQP